MHILIKTFQESTRFQQTFLRVEHAYCRRSRDNIVDSHPMASSANRREFHFKIERLYGITKDRVEPQPFVRPPEKPTTTGTLGSSSKAVFALDGLFVVFLTAFNHTGQRIRKPFAKIL
uniref:Uncharacterized protein n=1 Tax=Romanomermis culicivorax TaxID=13658 RepID=A0A915KRY8_ROMCU